jgi:hypothetical protein
LKYAGKDATEAYEPIHPPDTLDKYLDKSKHLGEVDMNTVKEEAKEHDPDEEERQKRIERMPILEQCYNLMDFEAVARKVMKKTAWAYYSSGADDEIVSSLRSLAPGIVTIYGRSTLYSSLEAFAENLLSEGVFTGIARTPRPLFSSKG